MQHTTETSENLRTQNQLTFYLEDFPVKTYLLQQDLLRELTVLNLDYGVSNLGFVGYLDQGMLLSKTQTLFSQEDSSTSFKRLPKSGIMRNGNVYEATNLARHNAEIDCMLYSTPLASETGWRKNKFSQGGTSLSTQLGGIPTIEFMEWLMTFPIGWTDIEL